MLLSMTGYGEAHRHDEDLAVAVEARTINSRYFKLTLRSAEGFAALEPQMEQVVRRFVRRGTVQVNLRIDRRASADQYRLNEDVVAGYLRQLESLLGKLHVTDTPPLNALLMLPGVVDESAAHAFDVESVWPMIEEAVVEAMERLSQMRVDEGRAMADDLTLNCKQIAEQTEHIAERAPLVVEAFRQRLTERVNRVLEEHDQTVNPADLIREVAVYTDRCDISEEIVRLRSHLSQFGEIMNEPESNGKKLEFLTQEMFRETNTIGSKANDAEIARFVIEIKTAIERMREMIQNVE